jgi:DICT domain-containing protein
MSILQERHVRYNVSSSAHPETHEWYFLIINDRQQTEQIVQKIYESLRPVDNVQKRTEGKVPGTRLKYSLHTLLSPIGPHIAHLSKLQTGKIRRDKRLYERVKQDGLPNFVDNLFAKINC